MDFAVAYLIEFNGKRTWSRNVHVHTKASAVPLYSLLNRRCSCQERRREVTCAGPLCLGLVVTENADN